MRTRSKFVIMVFFVFSLLFVLAACDRTTKPEPTGGNDVTEPTATETDPGVNVTFDLGYEGADPIVQNVEEGAKAEKPKDPERREYTFLGWFLGEEEYDFDTVVDGDLTVVAHWAHILPDEPNYVAPVYSAEENVLYALELPGKVVEDLTLPTSEGEITIVWTTTDADVITAAGVITRTVKNQTVKLTATIGELAREFWVTVRGTEVDLDADYASAYGEIVTLNPLMSTGSSDSDVYNNLVSSFYGGDYDWEKAIEDGYADFPGDFSKIVSDRNPEGTVDMPSIVYKQTLGMAARYPYSLTYKTDGSVEGTWGQYLDGDYSKELLDDKWVITLRDDLVFEDGTPITTATVEYSFQQYLNGKLANARANYLYNGDYLPLLNAKKYYDGLEDIDWEDVGFRIIDDHSFYIQLNQKKTQYNVMTYLGIVNLVHPDSFAAGFNEEGTENNYGSSDNPLVSYGAFTLKNDWEDTDAFNFERNETYFAAWDIPFKTLTGPIIKDQEDIINEFRIGNLDAAGVGGEFWDEFRDDDNLYVSPSNSFYRLAISIERPEDGGDSKPILKYDEFRRALYLATDRNDFANNVQPPSQGALGFLSNIHQVSEWAGQAYAASDLFHQQLQDLGLYPEEGGYNSDEAYNLFITARNKAIAAEEYEEGEVIVLEFLYYDAGSNQRIADWVKAQYEKVFNKDGDEENIVVNLNAVSSDELDKQRSSGDFDLIFTGMSGATFQATFGMGYIFSPTFSTFLVGKGHGVPEKPVEADIINLFDIISDKDEYDKDEVDEETGQVPEGMRTASEQAFFELLEDTDGVFEGTFDDLFMLFLDTPELETDYEGQEEDLTAITAGLEKALLEQMIAVPLFSSTSAAVYSSRVVRQAHAYHLFLGWGGMSYMYKTVEQPGEGN